MRASLIFPTPGPVKLAKACIFGGGGRGEGRELGRGEGIICSTIQTRQGINYTEVILLLYIAYNFTSYCFIMFFDIVTAYNCGY